LKALPLCRDPCSVAEIPAASYDFAGGEHMYGVSLRAARQGDCTRVSPDARRCTPRCAAPCLTPTNEADEHSGDCCIRPPSDGWTRLPIRLQHNRHCLLRPGAVAVVIKNGFVHGWPSLGLSASGRRLVSPLRRCHRSCASVGRLDGDLVGYLATLSHRGNESSSYRPVRSTDCPAQQKYSVLVVSVGAVRDARK
jgi:hypothetical protein